MNVTSKLFQIVAGAVLLAGWHLCAQDKSLPVDVSCTIESHLVSEVKSGFIEYTNEYPPKVLVYLHQTVQAEGDLSDTNYTDTFSLLNDSTWDPDAWVMASATTGTTDYSGANWWSRYIYSNADGTTTNNILTIIEWNDGWPDTTTNGPYYTVVYAWGNGGMFGWDYDYWNGGGFTDRSGAFEFIAGPYYWFLEDRYSQMLSIHDGTSETVEDVWLTAPQ